MAYDTQNRVASPAPTPIVVNPAVSTVTKLPNNSNVLDIRQETFTLTALSQTITNGASEYTGTLLGTFPAGRILVLGVVGSLAPTTTTTISTTITSAATGAFSIGSAVASNASLTSTMANMLATTAWTSSTTINVAAAAVAFSTGIVTAAGIDGTSTAVPIYFNNSVAVNSADGTVTWTGTVTLIYVVLGDN